MGREERNPASGFSFLLSPSALLYLLLPLPPPERHRTTVIIHAACRIHSTVPIRWQRKLNTPLCRQEQWTRGNWKRQPMEIDEEGEDITGEEEGREENVRGRRMEWDEENLKRKNIYEKRQRQGVTVRWKWRNEVEKPGKMQQLLFTPSAVRPASNPSRDTGYPIRIMWFSSFASGKFVHSASNRSLPPFATDQSPTSQLSTSYWRSASLNKSQKSTISALSRTRSPGRDQDAYFPPAQRCYKLVNSRPKFPSTHSQYVRLIKFASVSMTVPRTVTVVNVICSDREQWHGQGM